MVEPSFLRSGGRSIQTAPLSVLMRTWVLGFGALVGTGVSAVSTVSTVSLSRMDSGRSPRSSLKRSGAGLGLGLGSSSGLGAGLDAIALTSGVVDGVSDGMAVEVMGIRCNCRLQNIEMMDSNRRLLDLTRIVVRYRIS